VKKVGGGGAGVPHDVAHFLQAIEQDHRLITAGSLMVTDKKVVALARGQRRHELQLALGLAGPARAFHTSIFRNKNRRDIGKSQSKWTNSKIETPRSRRRWGRRLIRRHHTQFKD
jgi:hypothetical protein